MDKMKVATYAYRDWFAKEPDRFPLFHCPWWLDIVCGPDSWHALQVEDSSTQFVFIPLTYGRKFLLRGVKKPPLTPFLGPLWKGQLSQRKRLKMINDIVTALPRRPFFQLTFRPEENSALPFSWHKYKLRTRFTFRLPFMPGGDPLSRAGRDVRKKLADSSNVGYSVRQDTDGEVPFALLNETLVRKGRGMGLNYDQFSQLSTAVLKYNQGVVLTVRDQFETPVSSRLVGWDNKTAYIIAGGETKSGLRQGAYCQLLQQLGNVLPIHIKTIDFCGSMLPGVAKFNAGLGARAIPYQEIRKIPLLNW